MTEKTPEQEHQERVDEDVAEFSRQWWEDHDRAIDLKGRVSHIAALLEQIGNSGTYKPEEQEGALLEAALDALLTAYRQRDFAAGEEGEWQYRGAKGDWDIILRPAKP